jgi:acyl carrier protein
VNVSTYLAYEAAGLLSPANPDRAYRPFDRERDGLVLGEGAAFLVLERGEDARRRGAQVLAEVVGAGFAVETDDAAAAKQSEAAVRAAVAEATGGGPVDFVVAHGIGTVDEDRREARLLGSVFGPRVPVTAFKGLTGYLGAATAAAEACLAILALRSRAAPPIARFTAADPDCALDLVAGRPRPLGREPATAVCLSWSWLGQCAALVFRAPAALEGVPAPMSDPNPPAGTLSEGYVLERLRRLARDELEMKPEDLARMGPETPLVEGLQLDSLKQVVLVTGIEEEFGFELAYDDAERFQALKTVGDLVRLILERADRGRSWN